MLQGCDTEQPKSSTAAENVTVLEQTFTIPKGTSIVKAVSSLLGKKDDMIRTLVTTHPIYFLNKYKIELS